MGRVDTADGDISEDTVEIQTWQSTKCPVMYWFLVWRFHFNDTVACFTMNRLGDSLQSNREIFTRCTAKISLTKTCPFFSKRGYGEGIRAGVIEIVTHCEWAAPIVVIPILEDW